MRVFFTGGSGKAGRHAVAYLRAQGHHVINADQTLSGDGTNELQVDLMDFGQVIGAMSQFVDFDELNAGQGRAEIRRRRAFRRRAAGDDRDRWGVLSRPTPRPPTT